MFFQSQPRVEYYFRKKPLGDWSFPAHIHGFFELLCCQEGIIPLEIEGQAFSLKAGEAALIFPFQPHSFSAGGKGHLFTFDPELIDTFASQYANSLPRENIFLFQWDFDGIQSDADIFAIKSFLYAMCSCASKLDYRQNAASSRVLLEKIFLLTESHYTDCDFSLEDLSRLLGYDYSYVSKYFFQKTQIRFSEFLTQRRITLAAKLLRKEPDSNIGDIATACGYSSIRSFNRNFKKLHHMTPREYCESTVQNLLSSQR